MIKMTQINITKCGHCGYSTMYEDFDICPQCEKELNICEEKMTTTMKW